MNLVSLNLYIDNNLIIEKSINISKSGIQYICYQIMLQESWHNIGFVLLFCPNKVFFDKN